MRKEFDVARLGSMFLVFALALTFTLYAYSQQATADLKADIRRNPSWSLLLLKDAKAPPAVIDKARARLSEQPFDQAALNLVFAGEAKRGIDRKRRDAFVSALSDLGWRDTPTQQNLLVILLQSNDPAQAVLRADALLRRGRLVSEIVPMLVRMESFDEATDLLVERLMRRPVWRKDYFAYAAPGQTREGLAARGRLLERLMDKGDRLTHAEVAPSLGFMMRAGMADDVARIGFRAVGARPGADLLYDPTFARAAKLSEEDRAASLPFEWELKNEAGVTGVIDTQPAPVMLLRWNGRGAPVLARTMTLLKTPRPLALTVALDSADAAANLKNLQFGLRCGNAAPVRFVEAGVDAKGNSIRFVSEGAPGCSYPDLVISGRPQTRDQSIETTVTAIRLTPA